MNRAELIKELRDPEMAQPLGVYEQYQPEWAKIIREAGPDNCLCLDRDGWAEHTQFVSWNTYILKPDYQPEPEYKEISLVFQEGVLCLFRLSPKPFRTRDPLQVIRHENFMGFWANPGTSGERDVLIWYLTNTKRDGHKVVARFKTE